MKFALLRMTIFYIAGFEKKKMKFVSTQNTRNIIRRIISMNRIVSYRIGSRYAPPINSPTKRNVLPKRNILPKYF